MFSFWKGNTGSQGLWSKAEIRLNCGTGTPTYCSGLCSGLSLASKTTFWPRLMLWQKLFPWNWNAALVEFKFKSPRDFRAGMKNWFWQTGITGFDDKESALSNVKYTDQQSVAGQPKFLLRYHTTITRVQRDNISSKERNSVTQARTLILSTKCNRLLTPSITSF